MQARFDEFVAELIDDGSPTISRQETLKRVSDGVERYQRQTGEYIDQEAYQIHISFWERNMQIIRDRKYLNELDSIRKNYKRQPKI